MSRGVREERGEKKREATTTTFGSDNALLPLASANSTVGEALSRRPLDEARVVVLVDSDGLRVLGVAHLGEEVLCFLPRRDAHVLLTTEGADSGDVVHDDLH